MKKQAIELHDSTLGSIERRGGVSVIHLNPAYLHIWDDDIGPKVGEGWLQLIDVIVQDGQSLHRREDYEVRIADGLLRTESGVHNNVIPLPLESTRPCLIRLALADGRDIAIEGSGLTIELRGEAKYLESYDWR